MTTTHKPRKQPKQQRSQATVTALLDSAAHILIRDGYATLTTNAVAERAGVSIGSLYQYFPNKESLLAAVRTRHSQQVKDTISKVLQQPLDAPLDVINTRLIDAIVKAHLIEPDLHQALETLPASIPDNHELEGATLNDYLFNILNHFHSETTIENPQIGVFMLGHVGHAMVHAILRQRPSGITIEQMTDELSLLIKAYLTVKRGR